MNTSVHKTGSHDSRLIKIISENPGIHYSGIRKIAKLSNGSLQRNLKQLEDSKSIKVKRELGRTRYFDRLFSENYVGDISLLRRPTIQNIVEILLENDKSFFQEIVQKSKKSPSTISLYLSRLITEDVLERNLEKNHSISYRLKNRQRIKKLLKNLKI